MRAAPRPTSSTTRRSTARASPTASTRSARPRACRSSATTASTRRRPTSGRWPRRSSSSGADCMFFGGITQNKGVQVFTDVHAANPDIKLFGPDGVAVSTFTSKISKSTAGEDLRHQPDARSEALPAGGAEVLRHVRAEVRQGSRSRTRIYGYEAMKDALLGDPERRRQGQRPPGGDRLVLQDQATATRCSASTRSTRTATRRCPTTARTASRRASWCSTRSSRPRRDPDHGLSDRPGRRDGAAPPAVPPPVLQNQRPWKPHRSPRRRSAPRGAGR